MEMPLLIDGDAVRRLTPMRELIEALRAAFAGNAAAPPRHIHQTSPDGTLLLMPAWIPGGDVGVKVATVNRRARPAVQATYLLLDGSSGVVKAILDGRMLTARRTAAASALAAGYLARGDASTLLVIGTGTLVPHLIEAHASMRSIRRVMIWGRNIASAVAAAAEATAAGFGAAAVADLDTAIGEADIISAATLSSAPLIRGEILRPGAHIDLVGAFRRDMAEADPACFSRAEVFVDTVEGAMEEAGDLLAAIESSAMTAADIIADLAALCSGRHPGRREASAITLFKSVGASIEDLAAAQLIHGASAASR